MYYLEIILGVVVYSVVLIVAATYFSRRSSADMSLERIEDDTTLAREVEGKVLSAIVGTGYAVGCLLLLFVL